MKTIVMIALLATGLSAQASGFRCETASGLNIQVYNHTNPNMGVRSGAIMVVSDSSVGLGNKTIAKFTDLKGTLSSNTLRYVGSVDLRMVESRRKGELIAGTKLGYVSELVLDIAFTYARPLRHGEKAEALLTVVKRNGDLIEDEAVCERYLKN
ncbi:MAG: hypothetical protein ACK5Y2_07975 [Bdellovibrionales bacterium]